MKLFIKLICLLISVLLLSACASNVSSSDVVNSDIVNNEPIEIAAVVDEQTEITAIPKLILDDVLAMAYEYRLRNNRPDLSVAHELTKGYTPGSVNADMLLGVASDNVVHHRLLTREEAVHDAQLYFDMLRYAYAGYPYFGGDEVFLPIFNEIMKVLSEQEEWPRRLFTDLLYNKLSAVIFDNHLYFDTRVYAAEYNFFAWEIPFDKDDNRYYRRDTGLYIKEITGYDLDEVFRLSMNEEGEFFYIPVFVEPKGVDISLNITVIYENDDDEIINIRRHNPARWPLKGSELGYENNVPIITLRVMSDPFHDDWYGLGKENAACFLSFADDLRNEDIIIIDIRSNRGGAGNLPAMWLYSLTGEIVPKNHIRIYTQVYSLDELSFEAEQKIEIRQQQSDDLLNHHYYELVKPFNQWEPFGDNHFIALDILDQIVASDKLIVLLIDRYVGSAGEVFADLIYNMENTLVIGQNTAGCLITGGFNNYNLPYSNLDFSISSIINIFDETFYREGIGIAPDVWVVGDALKAALAMLGRQ
ncbi:MAG: S41 family peptidase [Lachnospiraceae bacterium]|nr:S41 family peptidase [Lachnospiraceae bacterium]